MRISSINPHSATQKTSIVFALNKGYRFRIGDEDGSCEVTSPEGNTYHVHDFRCDCPDALGRDGGSYTIPDGRHICKHVLYVSQLYPCPDCQGWMMMCADESWKCFTCTTPGCGNIRAFQAIKAERQQARKHEQEADKVVAFPEPDRDEVIRKAAEAATAVYA